LAGLELGDGLRIEDVALLDVDALGIGQPERTARQGRG